MTKVTLNGQTFDSDAVAILMDEDLREELHSIGYDTEQEFLDAYVAAHLTKYGEDFTVS